MQDNAEQQPYTMQQIVPMLVGGVVVGAVIVGVIGGICMVAGLDTGLFAFGVDYYKLP